MNSPKSSIVARIVLIGGCWTRHAIALFFVVTLASRPVHAQGACQETCPNALTDPVGAAACAARIALCSAKLSLYQTYMSQLSLGVAKAGLSPLYIQILLPHYPSAGLGAWRFGWGDRQPPNNTTTDCATTYFNPNQTYANSLALGKLTSDAEMELLFHELTHVEQCVAVGGRDRYAKMWFAQAELAFLQTADLAAIHGIQPMENDARAKATAILAATRRNRDATGAFIPPQADLRMVRLEKFDDYRAGNCVVRVVFENAGTAPLGVGAYSNASAVLRATIGTQSMGDATLAQLDPQGILRRTPPQRLTVTWRPGTLYTFTGSRAVSVQADPNRVVSDADRGNNLQSTTLACAIAPLSTPRVP
jgi:hypothetical protein